MSKILLILIATLSFAPALDSEKIDSKKYVALQQTTPPQDTSLQNPTSQKLSIIVSVPPQIDMIERIGKENVIVQALVPQGKSPELFEPSIKQMKHIQNADLFFGVGMPFEKKWLSKFQSLNPKLTYYNLAELTEDLEDFQNLASQNPTQNLAHDLASHNPAPHHHATPHHHAPHHHASRSHATHAHNPHIWLSPIAALKQIEFISQALSQAKPESSQLFHANAATLKARLEALIQATRALFAKPSSRKVFLIYHPAFELYARDFALTQLSLERDGKELKGRDLSVLISESKTAQLNAIFIQPEFAKQRVSAIAKELGLKVIEINPLNPAWLESLHLFACQIAHSVGVDTQGADSQKLTECLKELKGQR